MCGIVGGSGKIDFKNYLLSGLKKLEYRGYDSAGLAYCLDGEIKLHKTAGRVESLAAIVPDFSGASAGIAHTRWATHGHPTAKNAHPHVSNQGLFTIVHNGVIENFRFLKQQLTVRGFHFDTDTDTEVIANVLERYYIRSGNVIEAMRQTMENLEGSYALGILFSKEPGRLYFMKKSSPLLLGASNEGTYLASDPVPLIGYSEKFVDLNDGDYGFLEGTEIHLFHDGSALTPTFIKKEADQFTNDLNGYPHYMLKEIEEIPSVLATLRDNYFDGGDFLFDKNLIELLKKTNKVHFLACGTSYYASKMGVKAFRTIGKEAYVSIASEWGYDPYDADPGSVYFLLSQSGETADLIRCQRVLQDRGAITVAITNTKGSTIDRKSTYSCLLYAGLEVAVASTKTYVAQACLVAMLCAAISGFHDIMYDIDSFIGAVRGVIAKKEEVHELARGCTKVKNAFFLGRGVDYISALEGSLKLKEIAYVHAEAYPGGELKHGPLALIEKGVLVVGVVTKPEIAASLRANFEEVKARGGHLLVFASDLVKEPGDAFVCEPIKPFYATMALVVALQYLSYYLALEKGLSIDKPRNLAKSVTVE